MTTPLSERMLSDGMYPGIVEKWAGEVAALERVEKAAKALERELHNEDEVRGDTWTGVPHIALMELLAAIAPKEKP